MRNIEIRQEVNTLKRENIFTAKQVGGRIKEHIRKYLDTVSHTVMPYYFADAMEQAYSKKMELPIEEKKIPWHLDK